MNHAHALDCVPPFDDSGRNADNGAPAQSDAHRLGVHDVASVWERVRQSLQERIRPEQFDTWFQQAELRSIEGASGESDASRTVQLAVQNNFTSFFIKTYYMEQLTDALGEALGGSRSVDIVVDGALARSTPPERDSGRGELSSFERAAQSPRRGLFEDDGEDGGAEHGAVEHGAVEHGGTERVGAEHGHTDRNTTDRESGYRFDVTSTSAARRDHLDSAYKNGAGSNDPRAPRAAPADPRTQPGQSPIDGYGSSNSNHGGATSRSPSNSHSGAPPAHSRSAQRDAPLGPPTNGSPRPHAPQRSNDVAPAQEQPRGRLLSASDVGLNTTYRFDTFVVGPCNRFAHAAALGVSEAPGQTYNPLFLHGNVGLGKTHLIQSLCHSILGRDPGTRILYLSCESFVNHFVDALDKGDLQRFRNKYRNVDVLVVDDIHLLANKERTQEEFFHTFNTLYNAGKQIVLSSDSPPKDIPTLQSRLVSRFKWGLVTEIEPPCYETRRAILKRKSREKGNELPDDVASDLAEAITANIRELEGAVTRLLGYAALSNQPLSVALARECLRDLFEHATTQPNIEDVLRVVTSHFQIRLVDLQSRKRTHAIAYARQVGMYLARKLTRLSLQEIGGHFGGRDHSTVLYAVERIKEGTQKDPETLETVRRLEAALSAR